MRLRVALNARRGKVTLVFGARDPVHNQAAVIKEMLDTGRSRPRGPRRVRGGTR